MLATYLIRYANVPGAGAPMPQMAANMMEEQVGRLGGGPMTAIGVWFVETWLYTVFMSVAYGVIVGYGSCRILKYALRRGWIDGESYALFPTAVGVSCLPLYT